MPRPCVGCGFEVDENEDLVIRGVQERRSIFPPSEYAFCDPDTGRVWHKPFNLPWGRYFSQSASFGELGYPINGVQGSFSNSNYQQARSNASLLLDTPFVQVEPAVLDSPRRIYSGEFGVYLANANPQFTLVYVQLLRDKDDGAGVGTEEVGVWEHQATDFRPFTQATDFTSGRKVKWRVQAFYIGQGPVFAFRVNAICRDEGPPINGIAGNYEPGAGSFYG